MYRLASKVGLDDLRDEAFSYIRSNLTEHNILQELSCSLVSTHPNLLEMELDVLYSHIGFAPVVAEFPALARRIAKGELPHGADIIVGVHTRLLKEPHALPLKTRAPPLSQKCFSPEPMTVKQDGSASEGTRDGTEMPNAFGQFLSRGIPGTAPSPAATTTTTTRVSSITIPYHQFGTYHQFGGHE
jgi:hypothetical protein